MDKRNFAFSKINFILVAVGVALIIIGFLLISGGSSTEQQFNPDIFSLRRIGVGPFVCLVGFLSMIVAVMWKPKTRETENQIEETEEKNKK